MPLLDGLKVIASSIHGYGVVTTRPFKQGETICFGDGVLYTQDADFDDTYALIMDGDDSGLGDHYFWDLVCQTRWFNHSCDPNTEVTGSWDAINQRCNARWVALRDIGVGEEITYDYAFVGEVAEPCACGAKTCRGLIVDPDPAELAKVPEHLRRLLRLQAA
jgi:hypothetical protein